MKCAINARLLSAAELVRQNAILADIGTDHAYLPLFLLEGGRIDFAYGCDVNEGPLNSAKKNAEERKMHTRMCFILTDGATILDGKGITDYTICGMGGELIADIIDRAPHLRTEGVNLILQPMSRQEKLRCYLAEAGFRIITESYSFDAGKYYVCMQAVYDGISRQLSPLEAVVGSGESRYLGDDCRREYLLRKLSSLERAAKGRQQAGVIDEAEAELSALKEFINNL